MARFARVVIPGVPHHVIQRGNRRQPTFFNDSDYELYLRIAAEECAEHGVDIWAYCLMLNHVHFAAVPEREDSLRRAFGNAHRRYTSIINERYRMTGYLWQGRFLSCPMDRAHTYAAARYIEQNPVAAGICESPSEYPWSSARAHLLGADDVLVRVEPLLKGMPDWAAFLRETASPELIECFREHSRTGRPLGSLEFVAELEARTGRTLRPQQRGPKPELLLVSPKLSAPGGGAGALAALQPSLQPALARVQAAP